MQYPLMAAFYKTITVMSICILLWIMPKFVWLPETAPPLPFYWCFIEAAGPGCEVVPLCSQLPALPGHRTQTHGGHAGCQAECTKAVLCQQATHCCQWSGKMTSSGHTQYSVACNRIWDVKNEFKCVFSLLLLPVTFIKLQWSSDSILSATTVTGLMLPFIELP